MFILKHVTGDVTFLGVLAHSSRMRFPVEQPPISVTALTSGCVTNASPVGFPAP